MKKRLLFYAALAISLLSLITIIVLAAGIDGTSGDGDAAMRISYITSVALLGFTAGMALNIYYFIIEGSREKDKEKEKLEKTRLLEDICLYGLDTDGGEEKERYLLLIIRPDMMSQSRQIENRTAEILSGRSFYIFHEPKGRLLSVIIENSKEDCRSIAEHISENRDIFSFSIAYCPRSLMLQELYSAYGETEKAAEKLFFLPPLSLIESGEKENEAVSYTTLLQDIEDAIQNLRKDDTAPLLQVLDSTRGNMMACRFAFFMISSLLDQQRLLVNPSFSTGEMDTKDFPSFASLRDYIARRAEAFLKDRESRTENRQKTYTERIEDLIQEHLGDSGYGVQQIADDLGFSPAYLSRIYKERTGRNIIDRITEVRLEKAEELLSGTDMPITEICRATGYSSSSYFHRVFRKKHLISPGEYRQKMKESEK